VSAELPISALNEVSVFETLRAYRGRIFQLDAHLERFEESCLSLLKPLPISKTNLKNWVGQVLRESTFKEAALRLSAHWENPSRGRLALVIREFAPTPRSFYEEGIELLTAVSRRWTLRAQNPQVKASQFVAGVMAMLDRGARPAYEVIFLGTEGFVSEGTISNVFIVKKKRLLTPSLGSGILRGVTRDFVLNLAVKRDLEVSETCLTRHDLYTAEQCFITSTLCEVLPVVKVDGRPVGDGRPGEVTQTLREDFGNEIQKLCS
jgi:branched-chain amino acid aminotransferase